MRFFPVLLQTSNKFVRSAWDMPPCGADWKQSIGWLNIPYLKVLVLGLVFRLRGAERFAEVSRTGTYERRTVLSPPGWTFQGAQLWLLVLIQGRETQAFSSPLQHGVKDAYVLTYSPRLKYSKTLVL